jgi:LacI family transcriptional regulator
MAATLKQIAREVGVNPSTVSRVLNGAGGGSISESVRRRVEDVSRRLGYQVNAAAQSLARGATNCVGVLVPDLMDPVLAEYVSRLDLLLREHNLQAIPLISGMEEQRGQWCLRAVQRGQVDAIICLTCEDGLIDAVCELQDQGYPIVVRCIDRPIDELPFDSVGIDIADAYEVLMVHLADQGSRSIGLVGGIAVKEMSEGVFKHQASGHVKAACQKIGMSFDRKRFIACQQTAEDACRAVMAALADQEMAFDGLIVQSTKLLPGVLAALRASGRKLPADCRLACISDSDICRFSEVPVTVWDQPVEKICSGLVKLLLARMQGEKRVRHVQYASHLIVRDSTSSTSNA